MIRENSAPYIVYHYCSLESFLSIMNNSTIRLTNILKSNDRAEIQYCFDVFEKTLRDSCIEFSREYVDNTEIKNHFSDIDYDSLVTKAVINDSLMYYAACFSAEPDLLSQWRGYANDGKGVAIGFYSRNFINARDLKNVKYNKITYDMHTVKIELHDYIIQKLKSVHDKADTSASPFLYDTAINDIISGMVYNAIFYKNPAFSEENEWRLVFYPFGNIRNLLIDHKYKDMSSNQLFYDRMHEPIEYEKDYHGLTRGKLQFKCTDDKIISYVDMNFASIKDLMLAEIVVGPKSNIDDKDLRLFLLSNGYDLSRISIRKSIATYQ